MAPHRPIALMAATCLVGTCLVGCFSVHGLEDAPARCDDPLSAAVRIEETGEAWEVDDVWGTRSLSGERSAVWVETSRGYGLVIDFEAPPPTGRELSFVAEGGALPEARIDLVFDSEILCSTEGDAAEGALTIRRVVSSEEGYVTCLDASLRVQFTGCERRVEGQPAGELTFEVQLPGP